MSTGAGNDLERATTLARRMVTEYGMSERLGVMTLGSSDVAGGESRSYSEHSAQQIDREVRRLVDEAYARARSVIVERRAVLDRLAHALLQWKTLQGPDSSVRLQASRQLWRTRERLPAPAPPRTPPSPPPHAR